jgi:hypothetical protein
MIIDDKYPAVDKFEAVKTQHLLVSLIEGGDLFLAHFHWFMAPGIVQFRLSNAVSKGIIHGCTSIRLQG